MHFKALNLKLGVRFASRNFLKIFLDLRRCIFSVTGNFDSELKSVDKFEIEKYWRGKINEINRDGHDKQKYYMLSMFPYPSGHLHMGHMRVYTISDAIARFQRMRGKRVIHPIGWDAFGLPAENAAIQKNVHPKEWTENNIKTMKEQLKLLNVSFDWEMELSTCDPSYYKWTQFLFLRMFENGLAYKKRCLVNWDPVDQTVLADEQVDDKGCSWRSGCKVEKRSLDQWFLCTTQFAEPLYNGLNSRDLIEWRDAKKIQQHWVGECTGYTLHLKVFLGDEELNEYLPVWTDQIELLFGSNFVAISPENHFNSEAYGGKPDCFEIKLTIKVQHPLTGSMMPVFVTKQLEHVLATDSYLGIPCNNKKCEKFALENGLDVINVIDKEANSLINSNEFSRLEVKDAKVKIIESLVGKDVKFYKTSNKLRDWLVSRQRYWGTPIPIIHCPTCKIVPVPDEDLPVLLPNLKEFSGTSSSLKSAKEWINVKCPKCGGDATRETDTLDTFVDSSWYFLRYLDVNNSAEPFNTERIKDLMPVDLYIGGKEHAVLHLFYARFLAYFCHSLGMLRSPEPFQQLLMQGMILGQSYKVEESGKYISKDEVDFSGEKPAERNSKLPVAVEWEKMSKSKFNGVDPEMAIREHGIDTTRLFILFSVAPQSPRKWNEDLFKGIWNWQNRLWVTVSQFISLKKYSDEKERLLTDEIRKYEDELYDSKNYSIKGATHNMINTRQISVTIAKLQGLTNTLRKMPNSIVSDSLVFEDSLASLLIMLSPIAPHFGAELWAGFSSAAIGGKEYNLKKTVFQQTWPEMDDNYNMELRIMMNGIDVDFLKIQKKHLDLLDETSARKLAFDSPRLREALEGVKVKYVNYKRMPHYDGEINVMSNFVKKLPKLKKRNKAVSL